MVMRDKEVTDPPESNTLHNNNNTSTTLDTSMPITGTQTNSSEIDSKQHLTMMINTTLNELGLTGPFAIDGDVNLEKKTSTTVGTSSDVIEGEVLNKEGPEVLRLKCIDLLANIPSDDSLFTDTETSGDKQESNDEEKQKKKLKKEKEPKPKKNKKSKTIIKEIEAIQSPIHGDTFLDDIKQLHRACQYGQMATVSAILEGSSPKIPHIPELGEDVDAVGNTSLHIAAQNDQLLVLKILLRHCTDAQYVAIKNDAGLRASQQGSRRTTRLLQLFEERWSSPSSSARQAVLRRNYKSITETELGLLHDAAVRDDPKMIKHIYKLDRNALNIKWYGRTALHDAALVGSCDAITVLLNLGSDPTIRDLDGKQPFQLADKLTRRHFRKWSRRNDQQYATLFDETKALTSEDSSSSEDEEDNSESTSHVQLARLDSRESRKLAQALSIISKHSNEIKPVKRKPGRPRKHQTIHNDNDDSDEAYQEKKQSYTKLTNREEHEYIKKVKRIKKEKIKEEDSKSEQVVEKKSKSSQISQPESITTPQPLTNVAKTERDISRLHPKMKMKMMHRANISNRNAVTNSTPTNVLDQPNSTFSSSTSNTTANALLELSNNSSTLSLLQVPM